MLGENWKNLTASLCRFNRFVLPNVSRSRLTIRNDSKELSLVASSFFGAIGWFLKSMKDLILIKGDNIRVITEPHPVALASESVKETSSPMNEGTIPNLEGIEICSRKMQHFNAILI